MDEEVIAQSIDKLAESLQNVAYEIKEFRHDLLKDEWLRILIQGSLQADGITAEGRVRYNIE